MSGIIIITSNFKLKVYRQYICFGVYLIQWGDSMSRLNITIPNELNKEISDFPNKSKFIAEAVWERLDRIKKKELDELLSEGYRATRKEDKKINKEWEETTLESSST